MEYPNQYPPYDDFSYHPYYQPYDDFDYGNQHDYDDEEYFDYESQQDYQQHDENGYQNEVMEILRVMQQEMQKRNQRDEARVKAIQSLTMQTGQVVKELVEMRQHKGKLPSDTTINPQHSGPSFQASKQVHINAVSILTDGVGFVENECHIAELNALTKHSIFLKNLCPKVKDTGVENNTIPFPLALKDPKSLSVLYKKAPRSKKKLKKEVNVMSPNSFPKKLKDPETPLISIQVGDFKINRALLDFGASVNILPGSLYDQYNFGPLQKVNTTAVLADSSSKLLRGMVTNVIVKVEDFYYPADFMVLDSEPNNSKKQPTVLLGRPFLATIHATINCVDGSVDIASGDRKMRLQVFSNSVESLNAIDEFFSLSVSYGKEKNTKKFGCVNDRIGMEDEFQQVMLKKGTPEKGVEMEMLWEPP